MKTASWSKSILLTKLEHAPREYSMIKDYRKTADYITNWIRDYAKKAGVSTLVLGLSGGIDSALCALLCKRTGLPLVCVNMPCHSSSTAYDRAKAFADENQIQLMKVDLSAAHS